MKSLNIIFILLVSSASWAKEASAAKSSPIVQDPGSRFIPGCGVFKPSKLMIKEDNAWDKRRTLTISMGNKALDKISAIKVFKVLKKMDQAFPHFDMIKRNLHVVDYTVFDDSGKTLTLINQIRQDNDGNCYIFSELSDENAESYFVSFRVLKKK